VRVEIFNASNGETNTTQKKNDNTSNSFKTTLEAITTAKLVDKERTKNNVQLSMSKTKSAFSTNPHLGKLIS
jgi:hypothetical protein